MYAVPGLKFKENNWLYFWRVLVLRTGDAAFFLGKIMEIREKYIRNKIKSAYFDSKNKCNLKICCENNDDLLFAENALLDLNCKWEGFASKEKNPSIAKRISRTFLYVDTPKGYTYSIITYDTNNTNFGLCSHKLIML